VINRSEREVYIKLERLVNEEVFSRLTMFVQERLLPWCALSEAMAERSLPEQNAEAKILAKE